MSKKKKPINELVYSTETGRIGQTPGQTAPRGTVTIRREDQGHQGKTVTLISGLALQSSELKNLAAELKKSCGCGGSVKDGVILIQGDKREMVHRLLTDKGYNPKIAGE